MTRQNVYKFSLISDSLRSKWSAYFRNCYFCRTFEYPTNEHNWILKLFLSCSSISSISERLLVSLMFEFASPLHNLKENFSRFESLTTNFKFLATLLNLLDHLQLRQWHSINWIRSITAFSFDNFILNCKIIIRLKSPFNNLLSLNSYYFIWWIRLSAGNCKDNFCPLRKFSNLTNAEGIIVWSFKKRFSSTLATLTGVA